MNTRPALLLLWLALALSAGCIERADSGLPTARNVKAARDWQLAGSFGGAAEVSAANADPWQVRFKPGGFLHIAGLCATSDEVWVCDLGISRIQVFDFSGNHLRDIGRGMPLAGTLPTDAEHHREQASFDRKTGVRWEQQHGIPWAGAYRDLFRANDVAVTAEGYFVTDWTRTSSFRNPLRQPNILFVPFTGDVRLVQIGNQVWPEFVTAAGRVLAAADSQANFAWLLDLESADWRTLELHRGANFSGLMQLEALYSGSSHYQEHYLRMLKASRKPGGFYRPGGVALAFDKLVACDNGNRRLQVFDARPEIAQWGKVVRVIESDPPAGTMRFDAPWDIDIAADGTMYILDNARCEVAILDSGFNRTGSFGRGTLVEPYSLDLSDDGEHCFVSDRRTNMVYHYAAQ